MLYEAYQVHNDVLGPVRLMAETFRCLLNQPWPLFANGPLIRSASAAMELLSNAGMSHARPDFGIRTVLIEGLHGSWLSRRSRATSRPCCAARSKHYCRNMTSSLQTGRTLETSRSSTAALAWTTSSIF
jgi:poly-beta-hydroxyalkanoate depolymerase